MANLDSLSNTGQLAAQLAGQLRASVSAPPGGNVLPPGGSTGAAAPAETPSAAQIDAAVSRLSDFVQSVQRDLSFNVDDATGKTVVIVRDSKTDEVVRQIPSEEVIQLAQNLRALQEQLESSKGNLLEVRV